MCRRRRHHERMALSGRGGVVARAVGVRAGTRGAVGVRAGLSGRQGRGDRGLLQGSDGAADVAGVPGVGADTDVEADAGAVGREPGADPEHGGLFGLSAAGGVELSAVGHGQDVADDRAVAGALDADAGQVDDAIGAHHQPARLRAERVAPVVGRTARGRPAETRRGAQRGDARRAGGHALLSGGGGGPHHRGL